MGAIANGTRLLFSIGLLWRNGVLTAQVSGRLASIPVRTIGSHVGGYLSVSIVRGGTTGSGRKGVVGDGWLMLALSCEELLLGTVSGDW